MYPNEYNYKHHKYDAAERQEKARRRNQAQRDYQDTKARKQDRRR